MDTRSTLGRILTTTFMLLPLATQGQVFYSESDWNAGHGWFKFDFAESGSASSTLSTPATGNPGNAIQLDADLSGVDAGATFWGSGLARQNLDSGTESTLANIQISFDLLTSETSAVTVTLRNAPGNFGNPGINRDFTTSTSGTFESFAVTLDSFSVETAGFDPANTFQVNFTMGTAFGKDTGNSMRIDNVSLTVVPEPSEYTMISGALLLGVGAAIRRKRLAAEQPVLS